MTSDIIAGNWKQLKGHIRGWWGELTDDDLEQIGGKKDALLGKLQEKYGWEKAEAENEVDKKLQEYSNQENG